MATSFFFDLQGAGYAEMSTDLIRPCSASDIMQSGSLHVDPELCCHEEAESGLGESWMSTKKRIISALKPNKTFWHLYSLQTLNPEKFIRIVDKILQRDCGLIK